MLSIYFCPVFVIITSNPSNTGYPTLKNRRWPFSATTENRRTFIFKRNLMLSFHRKNWENIINNNFDEYFQNGGYHEVEVCV